MPAVPESDVLAVLRLVALRGRLKPDDVADVLGLPPESVTTVVEQLAEQGALLVTPGGVRLTPDGREELERGLAQERSRVDQTGAARVYEDFCVLNLQLKDVVTRWQVLPSGEPNAHGDAEHDAVVVSELRALHARAVPLLTRVGGLTERLQRYLPRLSRADQRLGEGDHTMVARPLVDSYHTIWFELHEDLMHACGLTRVAEATAGRAQ